VIHVSAQESVDARGRSPGPIALVAWRLQDPVSPLRRPVLENDATHLGRIENFQSYSLFLEAEESRREPNRFNATDEVQQNRRDDFSDEFYEEVGDLGRRDRAPVGLLPSGELQSAIGGA
jgi:hypothetical protein